MIFNIPRTVPRSLLLFSSLLFLFRYNPHHPSSSLLTRTQARIQEQDHTITHTFCLLSSTCSFFHLAITSFATPRFSPKPPLLTLQRQGSSFFQTTLLNCKVFLSSFVCFPSFSSPYLRLSTYFWLTQRVSTFSSCPTYTCQRNIFLSRFITPPPQLNLQETVTSTHLATKKHRLN